jgi:FkbM family methyltransferase
MPSLPRVTGFEPQQDSLQKINSVKTDLERYFPYAIEDGSRKTLYQCRYSGWTSFFKTDANSLNIFTVFKSNAEVLEKATLETKKLNEITEVEKIDFLKIDVQGSELDCLKSGIRNSYHVFVFNLKSLSLLSMKINPL